MNTATKKVYERHIVCGRGSAESPQMSRMMAPRPEDSAETGNCVGQRMKRSHASGSF